MTKVMLEWARIRSRGLLFGAGVIALLTIIVLVLLPGAGTGARGTPMAIVFAGFVTGMTTALTAAGIILVYRTTRIINFAVTAIGTAGATLTFNFILYNQRVPFVVAFVLGLVLSAAVGLVFDLVFGRRFFNAPRLVLTVLTIVTAGFIATTAAGLISKLPFFPPEVSRPRVTPQIRELLPFDGFHFQVGDLPVPFGFAELFAIEISALALIGLALFFRRTRSGVAVRAMAENVERASLLGISVGAMSSIVWILAAVLAGASVTIKGLVSSPQAATGIAPEVLLPAFAAAVVAKMRSLPVAIVAAIAIEVTTRAFAWSFPDDAGLIQLGLFVLIGAGFLLQRRELTRSEDPGTESWQAVEEQRPIPKELLSVGSLRVTRRALIGLLLVILGLYPFISSTGQTNLGAVIALNAIVAVSLVVLTGWAGQVSLGQYGFVAVGAVLAGALTARLGLTFWLSVPLATVVSGAFAVAIGIPALRLKGLFLAVTTFGFAVAIGAVLFQERYFGWLLPSQIERPTFFFLDFEDERSMYFLSVVALIVTIVVVVNLRRTRFGRILIAQRDNEANLRSFGVAAVRMKLVAFAVSGAIAGFAGAIFAHQQRGLSAESFGAQASIDVFVLAVIGGLGSVTGALLGAAYITITKYLVADPLISGFLTGGFTLLLLYASPGGLLSILTKLRDAVLRIVAQRRQIIVPSLFADYDPDALARRLIPLAPQSSSDGATVLKGVRFRQPSRWHGTGETLAKREARDREVETMKAAALGVADTEAPA